MVSKKDLLAELLKHSHVFVQFDGRRPGVILPAWLMNQPSVILQFGYHLPVPIRDLEIDDQGVRATLSFQRVPFHCSVPWDAVYGLADAAGRKAIFPEDLPNDITWPEEPEPTPPEPKKKPRPNHLKLVD